MPDYIPSIKSSIYKNISILINSHFKYVSILYIKQQIHIVRLSYRNFTVSLFQISNYNINILHFLLSLSIIFHYSADGFSI